MEKNWFPLWKTWAFHSNEIKEALGKITWEEDLEKDLKQALAFLKSYPKP